MSQRVSTLNRTNRQLEAEVLEQQEAIELSHQIMTQLSNEFASLTKLTAAAVSGKDAKLDPIEMLEEVNARLRKLQTTAMKECNSLGAALRTEMPITWEGVAQEVAVMGSWDNWQVAHQLNPDSSSDGSILKFSGTLQLRPGEYSMKLLVDGEWRLANGWPTELDEAGGLNNVIVIK